MREVAATLALLLACYLPGHALGRWCALRARPLAPRRLAPPVELVLGVCLGSWLGLLLAVCGLFSAGRLVGLLLLLAAALVALASRGSPAVRAPGDRHPGRTLAAGAVIALAVALLFLPPYDTIVAASDASVSTDAGLHLARSGTVAVPDRLLSQVGDAVRASLFQLDETGRWLRLEGMTLSADGRRLWPSFSQLSPVWVAAWSGLGGPGARGLPGVAFAALALWAIFLFTAEVGGMAPAALATALLLTNTAEVFYGRFLMPEIMAQFFVWSGLLTFVVWRRTGSTPAAAVSGLALGLAALTRVEFLFLLPAPVLLSVGLAARNPPGTAAFLAAFAAPLVDGLIRLSVVPSHYRNIVETELARVRAWSFLAVDTQALLRDLVLLLALGAIVTAVRRGPLGLSLRRAVTLAAAGAGLAAFVLRSDPHLTLPTVAWLGENLSWPVLLAAVVGLGLWLRAGWREDAALVLPLLVLLVTGGPLLYDPHVGRNYLWGIRRLIPVVIPGAYILAATALHEGARHVPRRARTAVLMGVAAALLITNGIAAGRLRALALFPDQTRPLHTLADTIPETAVVFFTPSLAELMIHVPLWLVHGRETAVLPPWLWKVGLRAAAPGLVRQRPVFLVTAAGPPPSVGGLDLMPRATVDFGFRVPEPDTWHAPSAAMASAVRLQVYEVRSNNGAAP